MSKIRDKFWGYRKQDVDDYFSKISRAQEAELEDLTKKTVVCQKENETLKQELNTLIETKASFPTEDLLDLALKRMERVLRFIDQEVAIDIQVINKVANQKVSISKDKIKEIEKEIEKLKAVIEVEIKNIVEIARRREQLENISVHEKDTYETKNIGKLLPIADWLKSNREEQPDLGKEFWGEEEPKKLAEKMIEQITSDGTTLESTLKPYIPSVNKANLYANRLNNFNELQGSGDISKVDPEESNEFLNDQKDSPENAEPIIMDSTIDFWEDSPSSEEIVNPSNEEIVNPSNEEIVNPSNEEIVNPSSEEIVSLSSEEIVNPSSEEIVNPSNEEIVNPSSEEIVNPSSVEVAVTTDFMEIPIKRDSSEQSQAGVRGEISAVRDKYIIGRVAGEDILDIVGRVIIRKDEPITLNLMELAQKEGKLADLIIHMQLPGQEE